MFFSDEVAHDRDFAVQLAADELGIGEEHILSLYSVYDRARYHGEQGWYQDFDFSSDADWCYGVGAVINDLERCYGIDDGSVFDFYCEIHGHYLPEQETV